MAERTFPGQPAQLETLIDINIRDFLVSLGIQNINRGRGLVRLMCWLPAWSFARRMAEFDRRVGELGLGEGGRLTLEDYAASLEVVGGENLPESGPLLVLSNHPGMSDSLALFASLPRQDLRIVAAERPFLNALGNVSRHLIFVSEDASQRMGVVRSAVAHLRHGGAVLTFPAGEIEPDPACMPGAVDSLRNWSESVAVFARLVPETRISVAIVSGVIWPASLRHPLTRLRKERKAQESIAASLQVLAQTLLPSFKPVRVRVAFSPVFPAGELASQGAKALMEAVTGAARGLIQVIALPNPPLSPLPWQGRGEVDRITGVRRGSQLPAYTSYSENLPSPVFGGAEGLTFFVRDVGGGAEGLAMRSSEQMVEKADE